MTKNKSYSFHVLRVGVAITFLWIGVLIFAAPEEWGRLLLPWAAGLIPVPLEQAMLGTAAMDILIGFFLLIDVYTRFFSLIAALHLIAVIISAGITPGTARDIGLLAGCVALILEERSGGFKSGGPPKG